MQLRVEDFSKKINEGASALPFKGNQLRETGGIWGRQKKSSNEYPLIQGSLKTKAKFLQEQARTTNAKSLNPFDIEIASYGLCNMRSVVDFW